MYFLHLIHSQLKAVKSFLSMRQHDSLHRYLRQIQKQILASHHLLEYCCAVNYFRPRARICTNRISVLSFCLSVLEDTIKTEKCDEKNLKKVVRFYDLVKVNTNSLMCEISNALSYVRPNIVWIVTQVPFSNHSRNFTLPQIKIIVSSMYGLFNDDTFFKASNCKRYCGIHLTLFIRHRLLYCHLLFPLVILQFLWKKFNKQTC